MPTLPRVPARLRLVALALATTLPLAAPARAEILPGIDLAVAANASFQVNDYGDALRANKNALVAAAGAAGANRQELAVIVAMAMQESNTMDPYRRDTSKDGTSSANVTCLNMNIDMLRQVGYTQGDNGAHLNDPRSLREALGYLLRAFRQWGVAATLNYQRGGRAAFGDGVSYGAAVYRNAIATMYWQFSADNYYLVDSRRIEISLDHVL